MRESARQAFAAELAADPTNNGTEEDWQWFFDMIPFFANMIIRKWGANIAYRFKIPIFRDILIKVEWIVTKLLWVLEMFDVDPEAPLPEPTTETLT